MKITTCILIISLFFSIQTHPTSENYSVNDFKDLIEYMKQNNYLPSINEIIKKTFLHILYSNVFGINLVASICVCILFIFF